TRSSSSSRNVQATLPTLIVETLATGSSTRCIVHVRADIHPLIYHVHTRQPANSHKVCGIYCRLLLI
ncbi:unnamed protein product, partial [Tenebrio molitor]